MQPDTIIPNLYNPQSLNRYSYVQNTPVNFNDPTGHMRVDGATGGCNASTCDYVPPVVTPPITQPEVDDAPGDDDAPKYENPAELYDVLHAADHISDVTIQDSVYLSDQENYIDLEPHWTFIPFAIINARRYLLANSEWYPTFLGDLWNQPPPASSLLAYHNLGTDGIYIDKMLVTNKLSAETLEVTANFDLYDRQALAGQGRLKFAVPPNSTMDSKLYGVLSDTTKLVITLKLFSASYKGEMQLIVTP